jgi:hypothetical protein
MLHLTSAQVNAMTRSLRVLAAVTIQRFNDLTFRRGEAGRAGTDQWNVGIAHSDVLIS